MTDLRDIGCWYAPRISTVRRDVLKELSWATDCIRLSKHSVEPVQIVIVGKQGLKIMKDILESKALRDELIACLDGWEQDGNS